MRPDNTGFSLLEVLVALAVLALAMSALIRTTGLQSNALDNARQRTYAQWVAANVIAQTRLSGTADHEGTRNGEMTMGSTRWQWRMTTIATQVPGVVRLDVRVGASKGETLLLLSGFAESR